MLDVCVPWESVKSMMKLQMVLVHPTSSHPLGKDIGDVMGKSLESARSIGVGGVFDEDRVEHKGNLKENTRPRGRRTRFTSNSYSNRPHNQHTTRSNNNQKERYKGSSSKS